MRGGSFEGNLSRVKRFIAFRDAHYQETGNFCRVTFQLTFMQGNMHELADIVKLAASIGVDRVKGHHLWAHFDEIKHLSFRESEEGKALWNRYVEEAYEAQERYRKPNGGQVLLENIVPLEGGGSVAESDECPFLGRELWISATGKISPCCAPDTLRRALGEFGNISSCSLGDVLESPLYRDLVANYKGKALCRMPLAARM